LRYCDGICPDWLGWLIDYLTMLSGSRIYCVDSRTIASYTIGIDGSFPGLKRPGHVTDHLMTLSVSATSSADNRMISVKYNGSENSFLGGKSAGA
jgi:hypothetical protein